MRAHRGVDTSRARIFHTHPIFFSKPGRLKQRTRSPWMPRRSAAASSSEPAPSTRTRQSQICGDTSSGLPESRTVAVHKACGSVGAHTSKLHRG